MRKATKRALAVGLPVAMYFGGTGGNLDPRDAMAERRTDERIGELVEQEIEARYDTHNVGRFALQHLQDPTRREIVHVGSMEGGTSLVGLGHRVIWGRDISPIFGDCDLYGSVWDFQHPVTEVVEGGLDRTPLPEETDSGLIVHPASSRMGDLSFIVDEAGVLQAADSYTQGVLDESTCVPSPARDRDF